MGLPPQPEGAELSTGGLDPCQSICAAGAGSGGAATSTTPSLIPGVSLPGAKGRGAGPGLKREVSEAGGQSYLCNTGRILGPTHALRAWSQEPVPSLCRHSAGLREADSSAQNCTAKGQVCTGNWGV